MVGYEGALRERERRHEHRADAGATARRFLGLPGGHPDPLTISPFPGNIIPGNRLNPVSVNLINNYTPLPNTSGTVNYSGVTQGRLTHRPGHRPRIDQYFGAKDQLFVHYICSRARLSELRAEPELLLQLHFPEQQSGRAVRPHVQRQLPE